MFIGYSEQLKFYRIYIPRYHQVDISRDVTFDEDLALKKSRKDKEDEEEHETPKTIEIDKEARIEEEDPIPEDHDVTEHQIPKYLWSEPISWKRKLVWAHEEIEEAKGLSAPEGAIWEIKKPKSYPIYMALMCDLVDKEPTCFEEAIKQKEWADAMVEEYFN